MMAMASSSSFSYSSTFKAKHYDVFLSFKGDDTRENFTSHLHAALHNGDIETFIDNYLKKGDEISPSLLKAIEESKIAIIVFSKGYASSRWCLEELANIIDCKNSGDLIVVPVFFHVDPSDVRKQTGTFREAFVSHKQRFELEKVQRWRTALTETSNISGFDSKNHRHEADLLGAIVQDILEKLNYMSPSYNKGLVGIKSSIEEIESLLNLELNDVIIIGIWGMGGIGKTTLAHAIFTKISSHFKYKYFQNDIREKSEKLGYAQLRQRGRLHDKKILLVFDDVSCRIQGEELIGDVKNFGPGSRIILTSRDRQLLKNCGVNHDKIYEVKALRDHDALTLFSQHAFKLNHPATDYEMISKRVLKFAEGVPLALQILGGMLFERTETEWESALYDLEKNPNSDIQNVLKISYDRLDDQAKNIFLDIACFFEGAKRNFVMEILDAPEIKISILNDKSLITIKNNNWITIHDLLQQMGRGIVKQESKDPGKRSRLWQHDDICHVLRTNTGTEAIECISLNMYKIKDVELKPDAFIKMQNLKFFDFYWSEFMRELNVFDFHCKCYRLGLFNCPYCAPYRKNENRVHAPKDLKFAFTELRYFRWFGYPMKSLPSNFDPENLIALILPRSNIKQLFWEGPKPADKLKHINLVHSKHLVRIPDLKLTPNLKSLILEGCTSLMEVPPSIADLNRLAILNLKGCKKLRSLPTSFQSESLEEVVLSGCSKLKTAPKVTHNMKRLLLDGTAIKELSVEGYPLRLVQLKLADCSRLERLPNAIDKLKSLETLDLSNCRITMLPDTLGQLSSLGYLFLRGSNISYIPASIKELLYLSRLNVSYCKSLQFLPKLPSRVRNVEAYKCTSLKEIDNSIIQHFSSDNYWKEINLGNCSKLDLEKLKANADKALRESQVEMSSPYKTMLYPGNEIPEWFSIQNKAGSSLTFKPPQDSMKKRPYGFAVCVVLTFQPQPIFYMKHKLIVRDEYGELEEEFNLNGVVFHKMLNAVAVTTDHVLVSETIILRREKSHGILQYLAKSDANVTIEFYIGGNIESYEIKKCGIRLLY